MRKTLMTLLGSVLAVGQISPIAAQKVATTPASITFADRTVGTYGVQDRITGDGFGAYTDATDGVTCVLFSSTGDVRLDTTFSKNPLRIMNYDLSQVISGMGPTGSFSSNGSVDVEALIQMHIGDRKLTGAAFATSIGQFHFLANEGGTNVTAVRLDAHTWTITTDDPYLLGAGDIAVLVQTVKNKTQKTGTYHLPFQLAVTCPTCVAPL
jgi:hypothetical protein